MKKQKCAGIGKIIGYIAVSKYMIKKYGREEAIKRTLKRRVKK